VQLNAYAGLVVIVGKSHSGFWGTFGHVKAKLFEGYRAMSNDQFLNGCGIKLNRHQVSLSGSAHSRIVVFH
jgi:hypothetical protein